MAIRSLLAALGLFAFVASSGTASAQMAGYPSNGGRLPGAVPAGPQFPGATVVTAAAPSAPNYGSQPAYAAPPLRAYTPPPGTDPLNGAPAVSYGTPVAVPQPQYTAQPSPAAPPAGPQGIPLSTPIATPAVGPIAAGSGPSLPTLAPPLNAQPTYAPPAAPHSPYAKPAVVPQLPTNVSPQASGPVIVSQAQPTSVPVAPPAIPAIVPSAPTVVTSTGVAAGVGASGYMPNNSGNYNAPNNYAPPMPDYSTPPAMPQYAPNYNPTVTEMPVGQLTQQEISPYAHGTQPPKFTSWLPRMWKPAPTPIFNNTPANANYGAIEPNDAMVGQSGFAPYCPGENCGPGVGGPCAAPEPWYTNFAVITTLDAFKNPMDLDGLNANFGRRAGVIGSFPIIRDWGIGGQASSTAAWYDWKGTQFTGDEVRFQNFNTIGLFARSCKTGLGFGIAHDWLYDDYYALFHMSQFRVAGSWEINCNNEVGFWGALPQRRDSTFVGTPAVNNYFQSLTQGNLYWKHYWSDCAWTSAYAGLAESPSDISYGANMQVAVNRFIAVTGAATYVLPGSGGSEGRQEEIWNLSFGLLFYPGTAMAAQRSQFRPMFAPADNGNFATWRR